MDKGLTAKLLEFRKVYNGHWLYIGHLNESGYGLIRYKGKRYLIHRLSLSHFKGIELVGQVNHIISCRFKYCFNPEHLYEGTQKDNMRDYGLTCTLCGKPKEPKHRCKECKKIYNRQYYERT